MSQQIMKRRAMARTPDVSFFLKRRSWRLGIHQSDTFYLSQCKKNLTKVELATLLVGEMILFSAVDTKIFNCAAVDEVSFYLLDNGELRHVSERFLRPPFGVSTIHLSGEADVGRPDSEDGISTAEFRFNGERGSRARNGERGGFEGGGA